MSVRVANQLSSDQRDDNEELMGSHLFAAALVLALTSISCGTFGSYTIPPEALRAAETARFLDRALVGVDFGPPGGSDSRNDATTELIAECEELAIAETATDTDAEQQSEPEQGPEQEVAARAQRGLATSEAPFRMVLPPPGDGAPSKVTIRVTIPSAVLALQGVLSLEDGESERGEGRGDAERLDLVASRSLATASALRSLSRARTITDASRRLLGGRLCADAAILIAAQREDGGWGVESEVMLTVHSLRALVELRAVGVSVPTTSLQRAADHLLTRLDELGSPGDAQGQAMRAQIFAMLTFVPVPARSERYEVEVPRLAELLGEDLDYTGLGIPNLAYTAIGLARYEGRLGTNERRAELWQAARRLWQRLHEETTTSPEFFDADGGELQLMALAVEALHELDREWFESSRREVLRQMITAREPDGGWGQPWRTAAAVRTLLLINPILTRSGDDRVVVVRLGERNLQRVVIDDLVTASEALAEIEVEPVREPGDQLEVIVESDVSAIVFIETEPTPTPSPPR